MADLEPMTDQEPTIGQLVASVSRDVSTLIQSEIQLAKAEITVSVKAGGLGAVFLVIAGFFAILGIIVGSFAIAELIRMAGLDIAWGLLIVVGAYFGIALLLVVFAIGRFKKVGGPKRAMAQVQKTKAAFKR